MITFNNTVFYTWQMDAKRNKRLYQMGNFISAVIWNAIYYFNIIYIRSIKIFCDNDNLDSRNHNLYSCYCDEKDKSFGGYMSKRKPKVKWDEIILKIVLIILFLMLLYIFLKSIKLI
jgi:hypothetical protein